MTAMNFSKTSELPDADQLSLDELVRVIQGGFDRKLTLQALRQAFFGTISNTEVLLNKTVSIAADATHTEDLRLIPGFDIAKYEMQHLQVNVSVVSPAGSNLDGFIISGSAVIEHGFKDTGEMVFRNHFTNSLTVNILVRGILKGE